MNTWMPLLKEVEQLRGDLDFPEQFVFARKTAEKLRHLLENNTYVNALGCLTGGQAVECAKAGLQVMYMSGSQVAGDQNLSGETYPDMGIYPSNSVPVLMKRINKALQRSAQIDKLDGNFKVDYLVPTIADAEHGFGGPLNTFELIKQLIEAGAAGIHLEDQAQNRRCGHLQGKTLIPTSEFIQKLRAARLAAEVCGVPTVIIARTDANSAQYLTSDIDPTDRLFLKYDSNDGLRTPAPRTTEGFHPIVGGLDMAIARGLAYAPYADLLWCETSTPSLPEAKRFAEAIHSKFPGKWLAYNCSPSFNWKKHLSDLEIAEFQKELGKLGFKYQFITLAGWHSLNNDMFELARDYKETGMTAYSALQEREFANQASGYTAVKHQREVGTGYFDKVAETISGGTASTLAMKGSTEHEQF